MRAYVYTYFVEHERPPTFVEAAGYFGVDVEEAQLAHRRLHEAHALLLEPCGDGVRMARPGPPPSGKRTACPIAPLLSSLGWLFWPISLAVS